MGWGGDGAARLCEKEKELLPGPLPRVFSLGEGRKGRQGDAPSI